MKDSLNPETYVIRIKDSNMPTEIIPIAYKRGIRSWLKYQIKFDGESIIIEPDDNIVWGQSNNSNYILSQQELVNVVAKIKANFDFVT